MKCNNKRSLALEYKQYKLKLESVPLSDFDGEDIERKISNEIQGLDLVCDVVNDNADYGFVNIGIATKEDNYITDYDIEAISYNEFEITNNGDKVGKAKSFSSAAKMIADNIKKSHLNN